MSNQKSIGDAWHALTNEMDFLLPEDPFEWFSEDRSEEILLAFEESYSKGRIKMANLLQKKLAEQTGGIVEQVQSEEQVSLSLDRVSGQLEKNFQIVRRFLRLTTADFAKMIDHDRVNGQSAKQALLYNHNPANISQVTAASSKMGMHHWIASAGYEEVAIFEKWVNHPSRPDGDLENTEEEMRALLQSNDSKHRRAKQPPKRWETKMKNIAKRARAMFGVKGVIPALIGRQLGGVVGGFVLAYASTELYPQKMVNGWLEDCINRKLEG